MRIKKPSKNSKATHYSTKSSQYDKHKKRLMSYTSRFMMTTKYVLIYFKVVLFAGAVFAVFGVDGEGDGGAPFGEFLSIAY